MSNASASDADSRPSSFAGEIRRGFAVLARMFFGARTAAAPSSDPAPEETIPQATSLTDMENETMKRTKASSRRIAAIAGRILSGKPYSEAEARALAASVVAQAEPGKVKAAKKAKRAS